MIANLSRVVASESILHSIDAHVSKEQCSLLVLMASADLHWRKCEWSLAIDLATRVLTKTPNDFHALSILASSYAHLGQEQLAYPFAKRLLHAKRPNWTAMKVLCAILGIINLIHPKRRERFYSTQRRCDEEAQSDRKHLLWAQDLILKYEAANDASQ